MKQRTDTITLKDVLLEMRAGFARQEEWNKKQDARWEKQEEFNKMILEEIKSIKECPTIKKELLEIKKVNNKK